MSRTSAHERARKGWGETLPPWIAALARACDEGTQTDVARRLGYSVAVVNTVLRGTYRGDTKRVETAVRGALMAETVACPVLGEIDKQRCLAEQAKPFAATSSLRVQLYRACRSCPNNQGGRNAE